jgi:ribulose-phosphate 3-epimerase
MIENADAYLESFCSAGADRITVHYEACRHLSRTVQRIKELGAKAGVCVNPATPVSLLTDIISDVDLVLIMSVNPGFGGQTFLPGSVEKLRQTADMIKQRSPEAFLEVDGGIDATTVERVVEAGANVLVAGNFIFGGKDIPGAIRILRERGNATAVKR